MATLEKLLQLNPTDILPSDNVRYALRPTRVEALAESVLGNNGVVHTPITVEELKEPVDGKKYRLVFGNYRTAAVAKLNNEQNAGLTLPARVIPQLTDTERLLLQVSENNDRENMSPMDKAIAIEKMLAAGISKMDVRKAFSAPGGRKGGMKIQPASNSTINMHLSFLSFTKDIQRKIHDGSLGIGAAYELARNPKEKWDAIVARAIAERDKADIRDEKEEEKFLAESKKADEAQKTAEGITKSLETLRKEAEEANALTTARATEVGEALKARISSKGDDKKVAEEAYKAAEANLKAAQSISEKKAKELARSEEKAKTLTDKAQSARERLEAARKAKSDKKAVSGKEIKKAAKAEGATEKAVKLNATEMRDSIKTLIVLGGTKYPKTKAIGELISRCFDGELTDGLLRQEISILLGEEVRKESKKK